MSDHPPIPTHQEIRTAPVWRTFALSSTLIATYTLMMSVLAAFMLGDEDSIFQTSDPMLPFMLVLFAGQAVLIPVLNRRKYRGRIESVCSKRATDARAPERRVYWRRDEAGGVRSSGLFAPRWTPAERAEETVVQASVRGVPRRPTRRTVYTACGAALVVGTLYVGAHRSPVEPLLVLIPAFAVCCAWICYRLPAWGAPRPHEVTAEHVVIEPLIGKPKRFAWAETDLVVMGTHASAALVLLRDRNTKRRSLLACHAHDLPALVRHAAGHGQPEQTAIAPHADTVIVPRGLPLSIAPPLPLGPMPALRVRLFVALFLGAIGTFLAVRFGPWQSFMDAFNGAPAGHALHEGENVAPTLIGGALLTIGLLLVITARATAARERLDTALRAHPPAPRTVTPAQPTHPNTKRWLPCLSPTELPETVIPSYEEHIVKPYATWNRHPAMGLVFGLPALFLAAWGVITGFEFTAMFGAGAFVFTLFMPVAFNPAITRRSLIAQHPTADADAIELPTRGSQTRRFAWNDTALVVLGDTLQTTRCLLINTTTNERAKLDVPAATFLDLLALVVACRPDDERIDG